MVFAGFFISSSTFTSVPVGGEGPGDIIVSGNFDVSAATLQHNDTLLVTPTDIEFKTDGTKLFVSVQGSTTIYEYSLSTAWDLTTVSSSATTTLSVSDMSEVQTIDFNRTGSKLYAGGKGKLAEFDLSTEYDLSTAGSQSTIDVSSHTGGDVLGMCFSNSTTKNYVHFTSVTELTANPILKLTYNTSSVGADDVIPSGVSTAGITYTQVTDATHGNVADYSNDPGVGYDQPGRKFTDIPGTGNWFSDLTDLTVSFWFKRDRAFDTGEANMAMFQVDDYFNTKPSWILYLRNDDKFGVVKADGSGVYTGTINNSTVGETVNTWHHLIFTTNSTGTFTLYLDGVNKPMTTKWPSAALPTVVTDMSIYAGAGIRIGAGYNTASGDNYYEFDGLIDDFRIYNSILTSAQAQALYESYGNRHYISTLEIKSPFSSSSFVGASSNVVPLLSSAGVAPDLDTTRTLEVSGGGTRLYQVWRNSDFSNTHVVEFVLGTPHDASTLTTSSQVDDYFNLAPGTNNYDVIHSIKIRPNGSEMFLTGNNLTLGSNSISTYSLG